MDAPSPWPLWLAAFNFAVAAMFVSAAVTAVAVSFIVAPYGRHVAPGWGPSIPARVGWAAMESPSLFFFAWICFFRSSHGWELERAAMAAIFLLHYGQRVVLYPLRMRGRDKKMPLLVAALAFAFNVHNSFIQGSQIGQFGNYSSNWTSQPCFQFGSVLFLIGFCINVWSDSILIQLRDDAGPNEYRIPRGFLFDFVSCPNYFGEMMEWLAWALLTWSWAGLGFFIYTAANLVPRALANRRWYVKKFENYPSSRRAIIPFLL